MAELYNNFTKKIKSKGLKKPIFKGFYEISCIISLNSIYLSLH